MPTFVELASQAALTQHPVQPKPQLIRGNRRIEMLYWGAEADEAVREGYPVNIDGARDTLLEAKSYSRGFLVRKHTSETLAVNLMARLSRADLRRCGSALLEWTGPGRRASQTLLWTALDRAEGGDLSKLVAGDVLAHMLGDELLEQAVAEKPDQLRATLAKALGGVGLEVGLKTVGSYSRRCGIIAAAAALAPLSIAEQLAVHQVDRSNINITPAARLAWLEDNKEQFCADSWLYELDSLNHYLDIDQRIDVITGALVTLKPHIVAAIDAGERRPRDGDFSTISAPSETVKLDAALALLGDTPTIERWGWVCTLWEQTCTAPSVTAAAATLRRHPELIGLVGAVDGECVDEHSHTLVAVANRAAETVVSAGQWPRGRNRCRGTNVPRVLLDNFLLQPNLILWLLAGNEALVCRWAKAEFSNNAPTATLARTLARTLDSAYEDSILWGNKNRIAPDIYEAILVNTPGIPDRVRYGERNIKTNLLTDTLAAFGEKLGENVDKWAALDALMNEDSFDPTSTIAETLAQLG